MIHVILLGDSIRMAYQPLVTEQLQESHVVWGTEGNGGSSANLLAHLDAWALARKADIVHVNCGLHDLAMLQPNTHRVPLADYEKNVRNILRQLRATGARIIWATTTPVIECRHNTRKPFARYQRDVETWNHTARRVAEDAGIEVHDLHAVVQSAGLDHCLGPDGVHMSRHGNRLLAHAVANVIVTPGQE